MISLLKILHVLILFSHYYSARSFQIDRVTIMTLIPEVSYLEVCKVFGCLSLLNFQLHCWCGGSVSCCSCTLCVLRVKNVSDFLCASAEHPTQSFHQVFKYHCCSNIKQWRCRPALWVAADDILKLVRKKSHLFLERFNLKVWTEAFGNWEQYDRRQDDERILTRPIGGEENMTVFSHWVKLIILGPGLVCI